jgi:hypothetical protein
MHISANIRLHGPEIYETSDVLLLFHFWLFLVGSELFDNFTKPWQRIFVPSFRVRVRCCDAHCPRLLCMGSKYFLQKLVLNLTHNCIVLVMFFRGQIVHWPNVSSSWVMHIFKILIEFFLPFCCNRHQFLVHYGDVIQIRAQHVLGIWIWIYSRSALGTLLRVQGVVISFFNHEFLASALVNESVHSGYNFCCSMSRAVGTDFLELPA